MPQHLELRTESLRAAVAPAEGGRVVSLFSLDSGAEFLLQAGRPFSPLHPGRHNAFALGACAGIEECLPTVSACEVDGEPIPDHGDFWQLPWKVLPATVPGSISLRADGFSRPLRFTREIGLHGCCLKTEYCIENAGDSVASFLYAAHPLLAIEEESRIVLPAEISHLRLHSSRRDRLGRGGELIGWPLARHSATGAPLRLDQLSECGEETAEMLYTDRLSHGWCGLYRAKARQGIVVRFDPLLLPYLGLWICQGGWPEDGHAAKQYAFAPEPTTAPCGSLQQALDERLATFLFPGESFRFAIDFCISPAGITIEEFTHLASNDPLRSAACPSHRTPGGT